MKTTSLEPRFVRSAPEQLDEGLLYISVEYANVLHLCCCGCGTEVATPLSPARWKLSYDGETVSLWPSVGNWSMPCRSHYIIRKGEIIECAPWTDRRIAEGREVDSTAISTHLGEEPASGSPSALSRFIARARRSLNSISRR